MLRSVVIVMVTSLLAGAHGLVSSAPQGLQAQNPLAALPSKPGPHIARIKTLDDNSWLELGPPAPDPKWGRARGRTWTSEMPLAPELRGAFLYGEGRHGYTKPDGRYMDDLWFYDINAHRWICCYPGAPTKTLRLQINADGFEATPDGDLLAVAQQVHGYEMNTYDTDGKRLMMMPNLHSYWEKPMPQRKDWLKPPPPDASPWFYETTTGKWNRLRTGTSGPRSSYGDTLIYLPGRKQAFFLYRNEDVWLYDMQTNKWQNVAPNGPKPPFGIDATSCYDSKRDRIYIGGGSYPVVPSGTNAFWIYDLKTNTWLDPKPKGSPCKGSNSYPTKNAVMVYDPLHDKVLLVFHSFHDDTPERLGVYVYDPNTNAWADEALPVPDKLGRNRQGKNGFYDPALNAVFIHSAGDSEDDSTIWVYRYRHTGQ
jgi:hypothetical protein